MAAGDAAIRRTVGQIGRLAISVIVCDIVEILLRYRCDNKLAVVTAGSLRYSDIAATINGRGVCCSVQKLAICDIAATNRENFYQDAILRYRCDKPTNNRCRPC